MANAIRSLPSRSRRRRLRLRSLRDNQPVNAIHSLVFLSETFLVLITQIAVFLNDGYG